MRKPTVISCVILIFIFFNSNNILIAQDKLFVIEDNTQKSLLIDKSGIISNNTDSYADEVLVQFDSITNKEYEIGLPFTIIDDFIQGLKSPHIDGMWIYASRLNRKVPTDLYFYNRITGQQKLLLDINDTPDSSLSFVPIGFSSSPDVIFVEAEDYIKGKYHLGVWTLNLVTKEFQAIDIPDNYMTTPLLNSTRDKLYFTATTDSKRNFVHGTNDLLLSYDLKKNQSDIIKENGKSNITFKGFMMRPLKAIPLPSVIPACQAAWTPPPEHIETVPVVTFRLPYGAGHNICTGRLGNIPPCNNGLAVANCQAGPECDHGHSVTGGTCEPRGLTVKYLAVDLTSSNNEPDRPIYPAANGEVSFIGWDPQGYGNYVEVEHANGLFTLYAHLEQVYVSQIGEQVCTNSPLGQEGTTGGSTGIHLHFEVRLASGCRGSEYVKFIDAANSILNYGDSGVATNKVVCGPPTVFVSNQDFEPNCAGVQLSLASDYVTVNNLVVSNLGDADGEAFKIKYFLVQGTVEYYLGYQQISGLLNMNSALMPDLSLSTAGIPSGNYQIKIDIEANSLLGSELPHLVEYDLNNNDCIAPGLVFIGNSPTCFDGIQNQGEFGIDCGGPCPACNPQINLKSQACASPIINGSSLQILYEISNLGSSASGNYWVGFFAYKLGDINPYYLDIDTNHGSVPGNTSLSFNKVVDVNTVMTEAGLTAGEYRIGIQIDYYNNVVESNESDNFCVYDNYFQYSTVNIIYSSSCLTTEIEGENINVYFDIVNQGSSPTGIVEYQLFIYDDQTAQYFPLGDVYGVVNVPANGVESVSAFFHLETEMVSHGLLQGLYEIGVYLDNANLVDEFNETDNFCLSSSSFEYTGGCNVSNSPVGGYWDGTYELNAPDYLIAPNVGGQCIVPSTNGDLSLHAGGFIDLQPGFISEYGSRFLASIDDCSNVSDFMAEESEVNILNIELESKDPVSEQSGSEISESVNKNSLQENLMTNEYFNLIANPNPFMENTTISFALDSPDVISLALVDIQGKIIKLIEKDIPKNRGFHMYTLNRKDMAPGTYILRLTSNHHSVTKKLFVVN